MQSTKGEEPVGKHSNSKSRPAHECAKLKDEELTPWERSKKARYLSRFRMGLRFKYVAKAEAKAAEQARMAEAILELAAADDAVAQEVLG